MNLNSNETAFEINLKPGRSQTHGAYPGKMQTEEPVYSRFSRHSCRFDHFEFYGIWKSNWGKMASRIPDVGEVFWDLAHLDFANMDLVFSSLVETISIAVLSLLYSLIFGNYLRNARPQKMYFGYQSFRWSHSRFSLFYVLWPTPVVGAFDAGMPRDGS